MIIAKGTVPFIFAGLLLASNVLACDATLEATVAAKPDDTDARDALAGNLDLVSFGSLGRWGAKDLLCLLIEPFERLPGFFLAL